MSEKVVIDAEGCTMGRLASYAAKEALNGKEIVIFNAVTNLFVDYFFIPPKITFFIKLDKQSERGIDTALYGLVQFRCEAFIDAEIKKEMISVVGHDNIRQIGLFCQGEIGGKTEKQNQNDE